jgi:hypothetical protein
MKYEKVHTEKDSHQFQNTYSHSKGKDSLVRKYSNRKGLHYTYDNTKYRKYIPEKRKDMYR